MRVRVRILPRAKKECIIDQGEQLKVYVKEAPVKGRANKRLIALLADYYHTKKSNIQIIRGETAREKLVEIREAK